MRFLILGTAILMAACNTTSDRTVDVSKVDTNNPYLVGYYVKYSEICAQFDGSGADNQKIAYLKRKYESNERYIKGYAVNANMEGHDAIIGLDNCGLAKAVVEKAAGLGRSV